MGGIWTGPCEIPWHMASACRTRSRDCRRLRQGFEAPYGSSSGRRICLIVLCTVDIHDTRQPESVRQGDWGEGEGGEQVKPSQPTRGPRICHCRLRCRGGRHALWSGISSSPSPVRGKPWGRRMILRARYDVVPRFCAFCDFSPFPSPSHNTLS